MLQQFFTTQLKWTLIANLIQVSIGIIMGIITFGLGAYNYNNCNNAAPVWLVAQGITLVMVSSFIFSRTNGVYPYYFQIVDSFVLLFNTAIQIWGIVLVAGVKKEECSTDVYNYFQLMFYLSLVLTIIFWVSLTSYIMEQAKKISKLKRSNESQFQALWHVISMDTPPEQIDYARIIDSVPNMLKADSVSPVFPFPIKPVEQAQ